MRLRIVLIIVITLFSRNVILAALFAICIVLEYSIRKSVIMQFTVNTKAFKENLNKLYVDKKPVLDVLNHVQIEATNGKIFLRSIGVQYGTYTQVEQSAHTDLSGIALIPLKSLKDFVKSQKTEHLTFTLSDGKMTIQGTSFITLKVSTDDFPVWPEFNVDSSAWSQHVHDDNFAPVIKRVVEHCTNDESRPILHTINVEIEQDKVTFTAIDGYALASAYVNADTFHESDRSRPILENGFAGNIPYPPAKHIARLECLNLIQTGWIKGVGAAVRLVGGNIEVIQLCYAGKYPDYRTLIARSHAYSLPINRTDFLSALKGLKSAATISVRLVKFPTVLRAIVKKDNLESFVDIPCETVDCNGLTLCYDIQYLIRLLESVPDENIYLLTSGSTSPLQVNSYRQTNILMPLARE